MAQENESFSGHLSPKSCGTRPDLLKLTQRDRTTSGLRALRQHDYGLTVYSFEFSDDSEKPTGRKLIGHDVVLPHAVEPIVRRKSPSMWSSKADRRIRGKRVEKPSILRVILTHSDLLENYQTATRC